MAIVFWIILALVVFSFIVFFHELGHFMMARWAKVKVDEFWLGIPPKAYTIGKDKKWTVYTLNWFPIGGFVRLKGEDALTSADKDSFAQKGYFARSGILLWGVTMNFILAWILLVGLFVSGVWPIAVNTRFPTEVQSYLVPTFEEAKEIWIIETKGSVISPVENSIAAKSGVMEEDVVRAIVSNGERKEYPTPQVFIDTVKQTQGALTLEVERKDQVVSLTLTPEQGKIGAYIGDNVTNYNKDFRYNLSFIEAVRAGTHETGAQIRFTFELLSDLLRKLVNPATPTERQEATESLSGPIGIWNLFVNLVEVRVPVSLIIAIAALISVNLGVFNLLPFPALDGGRFAFLTIHTVISKLSRGKLGTAKLEARANVVGFALLMLASIFVAFQDIMRIVTQ